VRRRGKSINVREIVAAVVVCFLWRPLDADAAQRSERGERGERGRKIERVLGYTKEREKGRRGAGDKDVRIEEGRERRGKDSEEEEDGLRRRRRW